MQLLDMSEANALYMYQSRLKPEIGEMVQLQNVKTVAEAKALAQRMEISGKHAQFIHPSFYQQPPAPYDGPVPMEINQARGLSSSRYSVTPAQLSVSQAGQRGRPLTPGPYRSDESASRSVSPDQQL